MDAYSHAVSQAAGGSGATHDTAHSTLASCVPSSATPSPRCEAGPPTAAALLLRLLLPLLPLLLGLVVLLVVVLVVVVVGAPGAREIVKKSRSQGSGRCSPREAAATSREARCGAVMAPRRRRLAAQKADCQAMLGLWGVGGREEGAGTEAWDGVMSGANSSMKAVVRGPAAVWVGHSVPNPIGYFACKNSGFDSMLLHADAPS